MGGVTSNRLLAMGAAGTASLLAGLVSVLLTTTMGRAETTTAADGDTKFLKILPSDDREDPALAPHLGPAEAAAAASAFFDKSAPDDATLASLAPFSGTENVPIRACEAYMPQGVYDELIHGEPSIQRRMKSEFYGLLNLRRTLKTGDCTCAGKVAAWEPVPLILAAFEKANGPSEPVDAYTLRDEGGRLKRTAERLCGGEF